MSVLSCLTETKEKGCSRLAVAAGGNAHPQPRQRGGRGAGVPLHDGGQVPGGGRALGLGGQRKRAPIVEHGRRVLKAAGGAEPARAPGRARPGLVQDRAPLALQASARVLGEFFLSGFLVLGFFRFQVWVRFQGLQL